MRQMVTWASVVLLGIFGVSGCFKKSTELRPPSHPDEYVLPPDVPRYNLPPRYDKGKLNQAELPGESRRKGSKLPNPGSFRGPTGSLSNPNGFQ